MKVDLKGQLWKGNKICFGASLLTYQGVQTEVPREPMPSEGYRESVLQGIRYPLPFGKPPNVKSQLIGKCSDGGKD